MGRSPADPIFGDRIAFNFVAALTFCINIIRIMSPIKAESCPTRCEPGTLAGIPMRTERTARNVYPTREQARADVFDYIERFYNPTRRHSTLGYVSPIQFEKAQKA